MLEPQTGKLTWLDLDDPRIEDPPEGHVILTGDEDDVQRIATDVQRRVDQAKRRRKRKQQRASRKRNR